MGWFKPTMLWLTDKNYEQQNNQWFRQQTVKTKRRDKMQVQRKFISVYENGETATIEAI